MIKTVKDIREFVDDDWFNVPIENVHAPSLIDENIIKEEDEIFDREKRN